MKSRMTRCIGHELKDDKIHSSTPIKVKYAYNILSENVKERGHLRDLGADGRITDSIVMK